MDTLPEIPEWVKLEHQVAKLLTNQEQHGWQFDTRAAQELTLQLQQDLRETKDDLLRRHPYVDGGSFTPKRNNGVTGYVKGAEFCKLKELNPSSRDHIAWILQTHYSWQPSKLTPTGKPIVDETVLKEIGSPISMLFLKCMTVQKMLGFLSEGGNAWLKLVTTADRIHHHCSVATNTHRCAHRNPNLAQVPSDGRFRKLFIPSPGQIMVGADLSGIELRMLAHYLSRYDGGRYAKILIEGDIHQINADKIGITRKQVKTVTYAFLYGAGDEKIGLSFDDQLSPTKAKAKGKEIRAAYVDAVEGLGDLLEAIKKASERGFVRSFDGRKILLDSSHKALNYLLQCGAGVIAKRWMVIADQTIKDVGICASQLAFIHDELQYECHPEHATDLRTSLVLSAQLAGEYYKLRIPIGAEAKVGNSWSEVH